jgi:hypothetical protein
VTDHAALLSLLARAVGRRPADYPLPWRVCHAALDVFSVDGASITMDNSNAYRVTLCATDRRSDLLENLQDVLGEGPCRDAFDLGQPVQTGVGRAAALRWPQFIPAAEQIVGAQAVLWSIPMRSDQEVIGAISMYQLSRGTLAEPIDAVQLVADAMAATLLRDPSAVAEAADAGAWSSRAGRHQPGCTEGAINGHPPSAWWPATVVSAANSVKTPAPRSRPRRRRSSPSLT